MLGFKGLAWRGVEQPPILPKPDLAPLTGGYRRIPVLQEGADLWCDTRLIARELERRVPSPTLFPAATSGAAEAHRLVGRASVHAAGGALRLGHQRRPHAGRPARGSRPPARPAAAVDRGGAQGRRSRNLHLVRPQIQWLADMLQDGRRYLLGDAALHRRLRGLSRHLVLQGPSHRLPPRAPALPAPAGVARPHGGDRARPAHRHRSGRRRWPRPAPPSPRRRRAPRIRRKAIPCPASRRACGRPTMPGTGSRAR